MTDLVESLTARRLPFVHATVVRAQEPTSARPGDSAVIMADGSIEGFVGGQCAENSVRTAALGTLRDGNTLLLRVLPEGSVDFPETPGAEVVVNPCLSGGAIEIFLRPVLPRPVLRLVGDTPIASSLRELARFLDFDVVSDGGFEGATAAVIAGLGRDEQESLRAALAADVGYIGLVASPRRGSQLLAEMDISDSRIRTPAGLWIGARTPAEIALSIMTELVKAIRLDGLPAAAAVERPTTAIDPICGMTVLITADALTDGHGHYYCGPGCLARHTGS